MQDRGLAAYIAELLGTFFLVFTVGVVVTLFVATTPDAAQGSDFAVIGLVHAFVLFGLILTFGAASGGHFNPAVTIAAPRACAGSTRSTRSCTSWPSSPAASSAPWRSRASCSTRGGSRTTARSNVSPLLGGDFDGMLIEAIGTFLLVLVICCVAFNPRARQEWAPLAIGTTLGIAVMFFGPLTGGSFNPARWFGPALIGDDFGGTWPYLLGPLDRLPAGGGGLPVHHRRPAVRARLRAAHDRRTRGGPGGQGRRDPRQGGLGPPSRAQQAGRWPACASLRACGASPSPATTRSRCRGRVAATASTARSPPIGRTSTRPRRWRSASSRRVRRNAKELLVLTGERPEVNPEVAERLRSYGHDDFVSYVVWACERALGARPAPAHQPWRLWKAMTSPACAR